MYLEEIHVASPVAIPHFKQDQPLKADHLNRLKKFFQDLILPRYPTMGRAGIRQGFEVSVASCETGMCLRVSPGMALGWDRRLLFLHEEQSVELNHEVSAGPQAFVATWDEAVLPSAYDEEPWEDQVFTCTLGFVPVDALSDEHLELARVTYEDATSLGVVREPFDPLRPDSDELNTREAVWLGATESGFVRPALQQRLAERITDRLAGKKLSDLTFIEAEAFFATPALLRQGLLSRDQFIHFLEVLTEYYDEDWLPDEEVTNGELIDHCLDLLEAEFDDSAPTDIVSLNCQRHKVRVVVHPGQPKTVVIGCKPDQLSFRLEVERDTRGSIKWTLHEYPNSIGKHHISHMWNGNKNKISSMYPGVPQSLYLCATLPRNRQSRAPFAKCKFVERRDRDKEYIKLTLEHYRDQPWPPHS